MKKILSSGLMVFITFSTGTTNTLPWKPWALASCVAATAFGTAKWIINKNEPSIKKLTEEITQEISALNQQVATIQSVLQTIQSNSAKKINSFLAEKLTAMPYEFSQELLQNNHIQKMSDTTRTKDEMLKELCTLRANNTNKELVWFINADNKTFSAYFWNKDCNDKTTLNSLLTQAAQSAQKAISNNLKTLHEKSTQKMRSLTREPYLKAAGISVLAMLGALWASWRR